MTGFRLPPEVIVVAVRWYLRFGARCPVSGCRPPDRRRRLSPRMVIAMVVAVALPAGLPAAAAPVRKVADWPVVSALTLADRFRV